MQRPRSVKLIISTILMGLLLSSCAKEEFQANKQVDPDKTSVTETNQSTQVSQYTYIPPKVDMLFLWDNSTSTVFINSATKNALNNIVTSVSDRFDAHIMIAPLLGSGNNNTYYISHNSQDSATPSSGTSTIPRGLAKDAVQSYANSLVSGSFENGVERAIWLLKNNQSNGVFRQGAYHLVVLMSNQDDNSWVVNYPPSAVERNQYIDQKLHELLCLRGNYAIPAGKNCSGFSALSSQMMRFISVVALNNTICQSSSISNYTLSEVYKQISEKIYLAPYTGGIPNPNDQLSFPYDAVDICKEQYAYVFDGVNGAIVDTVLKHVYNRWPVADPGKSVDPQTIVVKRDDGAIFNEIPSSVTITEDPNGKDDRDQFNNPVSGWRYIGDQTNLNTRFLPTAGEPYTGKMIELFGQAKVTYPNYLIVTSLAPPDYYGYVRLSAKPFESSIQLKINGVVIPKSSTNGWQLIKEGGQPKYLSNHNIKIQGPGNYAPATPAVIQSGYFLQVFGNAVYSNGDSTEVVYDPAGN